MSSTWTPRSRSAATVRVAYTAPLAPVTAIAIAWRFFALVVSVLPGAIERHREHEEVQDADVAVEIERALHLRQVVRADQRLFVDQHGRDRGHAGQVHRAERRDPRQRHEAGDGDH